VASAYYNIGLEGFIKASTRIDLTNDTIRVRPIRVSAYTFAATHSTMSSVTAATGGPGDVTLGTKTLGTGTDGGTFDAADAVFTAWSAGAAIDGLVIFKFVTNDAGSTPIAYIDGFSVTPNGGDITFQWQATNPFIFKI
jgi:hypothetical protein